MHACSRILEILFSHRDELERGEMGMYESNKQNLVLQKAKCLHSPLFRFDARCVWSDCSNFLHEGKWRLLLPTVPHKRNSNRHVLQIHVQKYPYHSVQYPVPTHPTLQSSTFWLATTAMNSAHPFSGATYIFRATKLKIFSVGRNRYSFRNLLRLFYLGLAQNLELPRPNWCKDTFQPISTEWYDESA